MKNKSNAGERAYRHDSTRKRHRIRQDFGSCHLDLDRIDLRDRAVVTLSCLGIWIVVGFQSKPSEKEGTDPKGNSSTRQPRGTQTATGPAPEVAANTFCFILLTGLGEGGGFDGRGMGGIAGRGEHQAVKLQSEVKACVRGSS